MSEVTSDSRTIDKPSVIVLSERDTIILNELLANPPAPNEHLRAAARLHIEHKTGEK